MTSRGTGTARQSLVGPVDVGGGWQEYKVHGAPFFVDKRYQLTKAVSASAFGITCSGVNAAWQSISVTKSARVLDNVTDGKRVLLDVKLRSFLDHPNILPVQDMYIRGDKDNFNDVYLVSRLMEVTLHDVLRSKQPLTTQHHTYFVWQAFHGLKHVHSAGVVHRDLKPGNILLNAQCDLVLSNLGDQPNTSYVMQRWYRPPECLFLSPASYTSAIDCWAMGCIAAELITRKPLFAGKDYVHQVKLIAEVIGTPTVQFIEKHTRDEGKQWLAKQPHKEPTPLSRVLPDAEPDALDFIGKLLLWDPEERMTAAEALRHPYLARIAEAVSNEDECDEPGCVERFDWHYMDKRMTPAELREELWEEMAAHRVPM